MNSPEKRLSILHVIVNVGATNGQYNEHCLPLRHERDIAICSYFKTKILPPPELALFDGDGSVKGFFRAMKRALAARDYDVMHVHSPFTGVFFLIALLLNGRFLKRLASSVYTVQNSYLNYRLAERLCMFPIFAFFPSIIFCGNACAESMPFPLKMLSRRKRRVVANAVDVDRVDETLNGASNGSGEDRPTIVSVGRLAEVKNPFCLLKAFEQAGGPLSKLLFVGEGHLREGLTREIKARGLEGRVEITGLVGRDDVFGNMARTGFFVSTSLGEGLPVAVLEAMACRRPVILSDIAPHREIALGSNFIPLLSPDDVSGFAREMKRFLEMPPSERAEIGEKCRKIVEDRFSLTAMHRACGQVYASLTEGRDS